MKIIIISILAGICSASFYFPDYPQRQSDQHNPGPQFFGGPVGYGNVDATTSPRPGNDTTTPRLDNDTTTPRLDNDTTTPRPSNTTAGGDSVSSLVSNLQSELKEILPDLLSVFNSSLEARKNLSLQTNLIDWNDQ